jgi:RNA polymerase sigma factor (sigma-70 family)
MASRRSEGVAEAIRSLLVLGATSSLTDGQLLDRFATGERPANALAFEALIDRHGSMVLRVCRSILRDPHDAQDAFQATFLVLVQKARTIRDRDSLASWLHGVALRVARHAKVRGARRRRLDQKRAIGVFQVAEPIEPDEIGSRLHEEVSRLPERYRAPVVLCYLEGRSCEEASRVLDWPVGTVKSRLSRARDRLRSRLTRLGLSPMMDLDDSAPGLSKPTVSPILTKATAEAATRFEAEPSGRGPSSAPVILAKGVLHAMTLSKLKMASLALLLAGSVTGFAATRSNARPTMVQDPPKTDKPAEPAQAPVEVDPSTFLLAPRNLITAAGSGTALTYALDGEGDRILDDEAAKALATREPLKKKAGFAPATKQKGPWKKVDTNLRCVVVMGILEHKQIRDRWAKARGGDPAFRPQYKRIDLERQVRLADGSWSAWTSTKKEANWTVLDNLPELEKENLPETARPPNLFDSLPLLKQGSWDRQLSSAESTFLWQLYAERGAERKQVEPLMKGDFEPMVMIRCIDFQVDPGATYRYRARVVFVNPEFTDGRPPWIGGRIGVEHDPRPIANPGDLRGAAAKDTNPPKILYGNWSEPTPEAKVP